MHGFYLPVYTRVICDIEKKIKILFIRDKKVVRKKIGKGFEKVLYPRITKI